MVRRVLSLLKKAGLVGARSGASGGAFLAKPASEITFLDVFDAVSDEHDILKRPPQDTEGVFASTLAGFIDETFTRAEGRLRDELASMTISDIDRKLRPGLLDAQKRTG